MIHYTPLSEMDIFPNTGQEEIFQKRCCVSYEGRLMYVEKNGEGAYELLQLLSTNPDDFMDETLTPGSKFRL